MKNYTKSNTFNKDNILNDIKNHKLKNEGRSIVNNIPYSKLRELSQSVENAVNSENLL